MPKKNKETKLIPIPVWIFFGVSLLLFCTAIYQSIIRPTLVKDDKVAILQPWNNAVIVSTSDAENIDIDNTQTIQAVEETTDWTQFLNQFYQVFSSKDISQMRSMMDSVLQKNETIQQFWTSYKITPFIDNITNNKVSPQNIQLIATSPSWTEEYTFELNYHLIPADQDFNETRVAKVRYTDAWPKLASIRCETTNCSKNPFFRPERYNLTQ